MLLPKDSRKLARRRLIVLLFIGEVNNTLAIARIHFALGAFEMHGLEGVREI